MLYSQGFLPANMILVKWVRKFSAVWSFIAQLLHSRNIIQNSNWILKVHLPECFNICFLHRCSLGFMTFKTFYHIMFSLSVIRIVWSLTNFCVSQRFLKHKPLLAQSFLFLTVYTSKPKHPCLFSLRMSLTPGRLLVFSQITTKHTYPDSHWFHWIFTQHLLFINGSSGFFNHPPYVYC